MMMTGNDESDDVTFTLIPPDDENDDGDENDAEDAVHVHLV